jgi:hypothetical protein
MAFCAILSKIEQCVVSQTLSCKSEITVFGAREDPN